MLLRRLPVLLAFLPWTVALPGYAQQAPVATAARADTVNGRAERPDVKVGESWRYRITDRYTNLTHAASFEVTAVTENRIHTQTSGGVIEIWDRNWNLTRQGEIEYSPFYPSLQFPLEPGKRWSGTVQWKISSGIMQHQVTAQVAGWERVTVPAGSFDAVKVILRGNFLESLTLSYYAQNGAVSHTIWYAPAVRQIVKKEITQIDGTPTGLGTLAERWELTDYQAR